MESIKIWIGARLSEKSTLAGIATLLITILVSFGVVLPETMQTEIKTAIEAVGLLVGTVLVGTNTSGT